MNKTITVYTTASCGFCVMLKDYLNDKKIKFIEKRVDQDPVAANEMITISGQRGVPYTIFSDDTGIVDKILGFDVDKINLALGM